MMSSNLINTRWSTYISSLEIITYGDGSDEVEDEGLLTLKKCSKLTSQFNT